MKDYTNKVKLIGFYGGDESHAASAWTSTTREISPEKKERIPKLLKMLAENSHETPFEKSTLHFLVVSDISSHIQFLKHRIGVSINAESARYKELKDDKFYVPFDWDEEEKLLHIEFCEKAIEEYHECLERLVKKGMNRKRAKETARLKLPYSNQLTMDVSFNFRSFIHFLRLRYSTHAQAEIRNLAQQMILEVINIPDNPFEHSLKAFGILRHDGKMAGPTEVNPHLAFGEYDDTCSPILLSEGSNAIE